MGTVPLIDMTETGKNIALLIKNAGYSVKDLQYEFGFATPQAIYKWLNGKSLPNLDNLLVLSKVLGVTIDEILITKDNV